MPIVQNVSCELEIDSNSKKKTKADKLKRGPMMNSVLYVQKELKEFKDNLKVIPFSSTKKIGLDELTSMLDKWYSLEAPTSDDNEASNDL